VAFWIIPEFFQAWQMQSSFKKATAKLGTRMPRRKFMALVTRLLKAKACQSY
jgi:heme-degrading monooxygenase HmoA